MAKIDSTRRDPEVEGDIPEYQGTVVGNDVSIDCKLQNGGVRCELSSNLNLIFTHARRLDDPPRRIKYFNSILKKRAVSLKERILLLSAP